MDATTEGLEERVTGEGEEGGYVSVNGSELGREGEGEGLARDHLVECESKNS